MSQLKNKI
jgi:hypothetical protein